MLTCSGLRLLQEKLSHVEAWEKLRVPRPDLSAMALLVITTRCSPAREARGRKVKQLGTGLHLDPAEAYNICFATLPEVCVPLPAAGIPRTDLSGLSLR